MLDEDALICDFAQYYGLYDYRSVDVQTAAVLAAGLPADSRCIRKLADTRYSIEVQMMALIADLLNIQIWQNGGGKGPKPESMLERMNQDTDDYQGYDTPEEFEAALNRIRTHGI